MDIPETLEKGISNLREVPRQYVIFIPIALTILVTALFSKSRRVHGVLGISWLVLILAYLAFTSLARIVA
jgi:membrane-bound ClpP family serine protease